MNYRRGSTRERQVMEYLRERGWWVSRAAGSHGEADLVALKAGRIPRLIQVKSDKASPIAHFGPKERRLLQEAAAQSAALALLAWWPPDHHGCRWYFLDSAANIAPHSAVEAESA